ncbi:MAG: hypothetical protein H6658_05485 [Ardenticatenaceae bacterium]|nr:hypothetical protein [Ardenticatenaceae bacterium]
MIRDSISRSPVANIEISSLPPDQTTKSILEFLETWFPIFREEYVSMAVSLLEDDISRELNAFLQSKAKNYIFRFNEKKGVDFQILVEPYILWAKPIFMIEAKRLPPTNPKDYVQGRTGGIERFKREQEGFILEKNHCAMVAYIQRHTFEHWLAQVNHWITELVANNESFEGVNWEESDKLVAIASNMSAIARYTSNHSRKTLARLTVNHFWFDMRVDNSV